MMKRSSMYLVNRRQRHSIARSFGYLADKYAPFLNMVGQEGDGSIGLEIRNRVAIITMCNESKRNCMSGRMMNDLAQIVDVLVPTGKVPDEQKELVGVVLKGSGIEAFGSGADLNLIKSTLNTPAKGVLMSNFMTDALNRLRQSRLVSVAVLNGPALGGGSELSTVCDFRIMTNTDKHFIQFIHAKIGASPGWGGARRLTNVVGRRHAIRIAAGSQPVRAKEALEIGLVDALLESPASGVDVNEYFAEAGINFLKPYWLQKYPGSVHAIKSSIASVEDQTPSESKALEVKVFEGRWCGPDNLAAITKK